MIKFNEITWYSRLAAIIFFFGALPVLTFYIGVEYQKAVDQNTVVGTTTPSTVKTNTSTSSTVGYRDIATCHDEGNYFVVTLPHHEEVGDDILVKRKTNQKSECIYKYETGDFEIKDSGAEYFKAIKNNLLITDEGTGPQMRSFQVYNLDTKKEVFSTIYSYTMEVKDNSIVYWVPIKDEVTRNNCSDIDKYTYNGQVIARIESQFKLDLSTLKTLDLGGRRCSYTQ